MDGYYLQAEDVSLIKEFLTWRKSRPAGYLGRDRQGLGDREENQAPDLYIALSPGGGIPARVGLVPGSAECSVYQITTIAGIDTLEAISGVAFTIYNLSATEVSAGDYVSVNRDKTGRWLVQPSVDTASLMLNWNWIAAVNSGYTASAFEAVPVDNVAPGGSIAIVLPASPNDNDRVLIAKYWVSGVGRNVSVGVGGGGNMNGKVATGDNLTPGAGAWVFIYSATNSSWFCERRLNNE